MTLFVCQIRASLSWQKEFPIRVKFHRILDNANFIFTPIQIHQNITHISPDQTANKTDTVPLHCTADGKPTPNMIWTSPNGSEISFEPNFTLTITSKLDEGHYSCTAYNRAGNPVTTMANITVESELVNIYTYRCNKNPAYSTFSLQLVI